MSTLVKIANSTTTKGYVTSLLVHTGAFALGMAASSWVVAPVTVVKFGSRAQRAIELSISVPAAASGEIEPPQIEVVISPHHARMGDRAFVYIPGAEAAAPTVDSIIPDKILTPVLPQRPSDAIREAAIEPSPTEHPRPRSRRAAVATPSVAEMPLPKLPFYFIGRVPRYPAEAAARGWEGTVTLLIHIDSAGRVVRVDIETSSGFPPADAEAVRTVLTWRAVPRNPGEPLKVTVVRNPVEFTLDESRRTGGTP